MRDGTIGKASKGNQSGLSSAGKTVGKISAKNLGTMATDIAGDSAKSAAGGTIWAIEDMQLGLSSAEGKISVQKPGDAILMLKYQNQMRKGLQAQLKASQ